ncbi:hypothetical protein Tco_0901080 [Tanacetum coccineum]
MLMEILLEPTQTICGRKIVTYRFTLTVLSALRRSGNENGIRIKHESNGIEISQSYYIEKVLKKFNYFECTPVSTLMDTSEKLMPNNGKLRHRFSSNHRSGRFTRCKLYFWICNNYEDIFVYKWLGIPCLWVGGNFWASKKQACITGSTMEYEFVALAAAVRKLNG